MASDRRTQILVGAAVLVLAIVGYRFGFMTSAAPTAASNERTQRSAAATSGRSAPAGVAEPDVHLQALEEERPKPGGQERNLFRFKPKAPPPPLPGARIPGAAPPAPVPTGPPPPPPLPPINFKFIGVIDQGAGKPKIAILTDGVGPPVHGVEGGSVAGRYKILRIGAESIEMAYLDGRGRQTIRLSGS
jgi:hypothetical protein